MHFFYLVVAVILSLGRVQHFVTPWIVAHQAPLSSTISWSLLKLMPIELVILSNHLTLCWPLQSFPASRSFPVSQLFAKGGQRIGASASASVLPLNIQGWFPLGSLLFKGLSRVFSSTTIWKHQFFRWYRNLVNPREETAEWDKSLKSP